MSENNNQNKNPNEMPQASNGVKYILDFDGVLFNVDALKEKMNALGIPLSSRSEKTFEQITQKDPHFNFEDLVFPDAKLFIEKHYRDCIIVSTHVSSTQEAPQNSTESYAYQLEKIVRSGMKRLGIQDIRVSGSQKKEELQKIQQEFGENCLFVDDRGAYVAESESLGMRTFFMNRKKTIGPFEFITNFERTKEIASFHELERLLV